MLYIVCILVLCQLYVLQIPPLNLWLVFSPYLWCLWWTEVPYFHEANCTTFFFIVNAFNVLFNELFLVLKPEKVSPRFFSESLTVLSFTLVILCVIQHYLLSSFSFVLLISIIKFQYMYHFVSFFLSQLSLCPNTFCSHSIYATFYTVSLFYVILFFISPYCFVTIMFMLIQNFAGFLFMHSILLIS